MNTTPKTISVIGAGIAGISCAYLLQKNLPETKITLIDKAGFPAKNASFIAGGMIAPLSELDHMPQSYLGAGYESIEIWRKIANEADTDFEFSANGSLFLAHDADRHLLERFKSLLPQDSQDWESINAQSIRVLENNLPDQVFRNGLHMKKEAHLHPQKAMNAILNLIENKEQRETIPENETKNADIVIDCRGMDAKQSLSNLRGVKGETLIVENPEFSLSRPIRLMHPRYPLYIVPRKDNIFMIGATIIESEGSGAITIRSAMELMSALYSIHKSFGEAKILDMPSGIRPSLPNNIPQIQLENNVFSVNGLFRHGFLFAPVMAQTLVRYIKNEEDEFRTMFMKEM